MSFLRSLLGCTARSMLRSLLSSLLSSSACTSSTASGASAAARTRAGDVGLRLLRPFSSRFRSPDGIFSCSAWTVVHTRISLNLYMKIYICRNPGTL